MIVQANLCEELTSGHLIEVLKSVTLDLYNTGQPVTVFNKNGDGDVAMKIFQISPNLATPDTDDLTYVQVSQYSLRIRCAVLLCELMVTMVIDVKN